MATHYSRLQLKVNPALQYKDFSFQFLVVNRELGKTIYKDEGSFDDKGFGKWFHIYQPNRVLMYKIIYRGKVVKTITAKAYPEPNKWSLFELKTTTGTTKQAKEHVQEIQINDGEVAWYLVKQNEPVMTWAQRVFKKPLTEKGWGILKANNPHLTNLVSMGVLQPGQVVIISNSTTAKELPVYKKQAQQAHDNLEQMKKDKDFDPAYFAAIYDPLQDIKVQSDLVGLSKESINGDFSEIFKKNMEKDPFIFSSKVAIDSAVGVVGEANREAMNSYTDLLRKMDYEKRLKSEHSYRRNFYLFEQKYASEFNRMNQAAGQRFFSWNHGINYKNNRDSIRRTVFMRTKNSSSLEDYIKKMDETSKVSKTLKWGGRLIFTAEVAQSGMAVADVYKTGDSDATRKEILVQTGKIEGGLAGAGLGAAVGGMLVTAVAGTAGLPVLVIVGVVAVGLTVGVGYFGGVAGASLTEYAYERLTKE
ncbi:hypothetical protein [Acinetobacter sp. NIPH 2699]|uniref:hypothetical protein n=1 Tax=Acinetobacter sp. NIPH 2699 TaxID=2923433 RepID=UPI001F4B8E45|nr:hypothetical protein [Acinetobacter sp. NIPH 2699]MCH7336860.1 hypothetical protein [Acinetobacter sp. NIPH 2699]